MAATAYSTATAREQDSRVPHFNSLRLRRFTVNEYQRMIELCLLGKRARVELLEGWIVDKMTVNPPHARASRQVSAVLPKHLPPQWLLQAQLPIETTDSQPEPGFAVVRGPNRRYHDRHPGPADIGLLIEISDTALEDDREEMGRIYARAGVPIYWIINVRDSIIEVYTRPKGGKKPAYAQRQVFQKADRVPLILDAAKIAEIPVADLLP